MLNNQKSSPRACVDASREAGVIPVLVLVAAIGLIGFLAISSSADFKNKLFAQLFSKPSSHAVSGPISSPIISPFPTPTLAPTPVPTPAPDTINPSVSITFPINGSTVRKNSNVTIQATASDNVGVSKVEFYVAGSIVCTDTAAPYSCVWRVPKPPRVTYSIQAKAYDTSNNSAQHSISITSK